VQGRSPQFITRWLEANRHRFDGPAQYQGDEPGSVLAETGHDRKALWSQRHRCRWLIPASWDYSQAAGNMAIPAVYRAVSDADATFLADRFYLPATPRDLGLLERGGIPVFGIETRHQLADFDVVGTSISYTVLFLNFCKMLAMSGIPLRRADRAANAGRYPMVITGGQAYCAPEFMSPVVDCVWLGEVEDEEGNPGGIGEVSECIARFKEDGTWLSDRTGCYERLARWFSHLYFPQFTEFTYGYQDRDLPEPVKLVSGHYPLLSGMAYPHRSRQVRDLNKTRPLVQAPLLYTDPGMGAGDVEVARGCPAWCSFCRLSWVTKPYRQEDVARTIDKAGQWRLNMGSTGISLVAPDPPMHTQTKRLIAGLLENVTDEVDASSMRIDDFIADPDLSVLMSLAGSDAITLGLEGNSQRMRDLAGKGTSDDDVAEAVTRAIRAGIRKIKLYMITNWPGEEAGDVMRIVELGRRLAAIRDGFGQSAEGVHITFSWTPILVEAQTPLQWFAVTAPDYTLQKALDMLRDMRIDVKIGTKANPAKLAFFQACQRASREAGEAIVDVIEGIGTASWGGFPKDMRERLDVALRAHGFRNGLADLFGERYRDDLFGWEHIDTGVSVDLMWRAYADMLEFLQGTDADTYDQHCTGPYHGNEWVKRCDQGCQGSTCGACQPADLRLRTEYIRAGASERNLDTQPVQPLDHTTVACRVRLRVRRPEQHRDISNESYRFIVRRALLRTGRLWETRFSAITFPAIASRSIRLASDPFTYRDRSAGIDYVEFGVTRPIAQDQAAAFMFDADTELRPWLEWDKWGQSVLILPASGRLPARPSSLWELEVDEDLEALVAALRRWDEADSVPVLLRADSFYAGAMVERGDAKEHVADVWAVRDGHRTLLRMMLTGRLGPYQAFAALIGRASWIEAAAKTAMRIEFYGGESLACVGCGYPIPVTLQDIPSDDSYCPRCLDELSGKVMAGLVRPGV
jgi:hypothetical protein